MRNAAILWSVLSVEDQHASGTETHPPGTRPLHFASKCVQHGTLHTGAQAQPRAHPLERAFLSFKSNQKQVAWQPDAPPSTQRDLVRAPLQVASA